MNTNTQHGLRHVPDLKTLEGRLGVEFVKQDLLLTACTHRSFLNEHKGQGLEHNERLEFLGDAVLELVVTDFLFRKYPHKAEGDLTAYRSALVNTVSLSKAAQHIELNQFLRLSRGESRDTGRARQIILADAFEAVIGALYEDQGLEVARQFIHHKLMGVIDIDEIVHKKLWLDAKSRFQEKAQEEFSVTPVYKVLKDSGPDHDKVFNIGVFLGDIHVASGSGSSKQEAEQKAAEKGLETKGWE